MRNPFYAPVTPAPVDEGKHAAVTAIVRRYLQVNSAYQEIPDRKIRALHPALHDEAVFSQVTKGLAPAKAAAPRTREGGAGRAPGEDGVTE